MGIIYMISSCILIILTLLIKKEEKQNLIKEMVVTGILYTCYQVFICFLLNLIKIPIKLEILLFINAMVCITLLAYIIKNKQIQKYFIDKKDILFISIIIITQLPVLYKQYGCLNSIKFYTTDAYVHYTAAKEFYKSDTLLNRKGIEEIKIDRTFMPFAYINEGILMKATASYIGGEPNLYKIFLFSECNIYLGTIFVFYFLLKNRVKEKWKTIIIFIFTIFCAMGYPLNCLLTGFHYLQINVILALTIMLLLQENKKKNYLSIFLLNLGVILSYNLFAPFVYVAQFFYWLINKIKKNIDRKMLLKYIIITLILPGIMGLYFYFFSTNGGTSNMPQINPLLLDGYIYRNLWSTIILYIPFSIYYIIKKIKQKNIDYGLCFGICTILYALCLGICWKMEKISSYYYFKIYYMLWPILFYLCYQGMILFCKKEKDRKSTCFLCVFIYIILFVMLTVNVNYTMVRGYECEKEDVTTIMGVYNRNQYLYKMPQIYTKEEMETLQYVFEKLPIDETLFIAVPMQERWIQAIYNHDNRKEIDINDMEEQIQKWNNKEKYKYLVCYKGKSYCQRFLGKINLQNSHCIYQNGNCEILEKE